MVNVICDLDEEDCQCGKCGSTMTCIGEKVIRTELCYRPASFFQKRYITKTYACHCHDEEALEPREFRCAQVPKGPIQRSFAGPSLLAEVFHNKFELSLPLHRQVAEWKRFGLEVSDKTLANWVIIASHDWLAPIYHLLREELSKQTVLHADETPYQILNRSDGKDATAQARIWLFRTIKESEHPVVYYHVDLTRERSVVTSILDKFKGYLHCDGYSGYKNIPNIELVGCWAHVRRKFFEVPGESGQAKTALSYCDRIFRLERKLKDLSPEERYEKRQSIIKPVVDEFFNWLDSFYAMKGKLQTAVIYARNQKKELTRFLENGSLEVSNNLAEQAIRPVAIGRKNYLFSKSMKGAEANVMAYTIIRTAKENGLNPTKYLTHLFKKLPNVEFYQNSELLLDFLPWAKNVQKSCK